MTQSRVKVTREKVSIYVYRNFSHIIVHIFLQRYHIINQIIKKLVIYIYLVLIVIKYNIFRINKELICTQNWTKFAPNNKNSTDVYEINDEFYCGSGDVLLPIWQRLFLERFENIALIWHAWACMASISILFSVSKLRALKSSGGGGGYSLCQGSSGMGIPRAALVGPHFFEKTIHIMVVPDSERYPLLKHTPHFC